MPDRVDAPDYDKEVKPKLEEDNDGPMTFPHVAIVVRGPNGIDKILVVEAAAGVEVFAYHRDPRTGQHEKDWAIWPKPSSKYPGR